MKESKTIVCAEPSPDSLSAYAAEIAAEANIPQSVTAQLAAAFQESSSFVGLRTQSIQLLRDSLYRLCEGYMSGALDKAKYDILMRRYQKYMVALLAIEQLTGAVKSPAVIINTEGSASAAQSISSLRFQLKSIDDEIAELESEKKNEEAKKSADGVSEEDKKKIDAKIAEIDKQLNELNTDKAAVSKAIETARGLAVSGKTSSSISSVGTITQKSDQHLQAVSNTVEKIVLNIVETDDTGQLCWSYMSDKNFNNESELGKSCVAYINNKNRNSKLILDVQEQLLKSEDLSEEQLIEILKNLLKNSDNGWEINVL